MKYFLIITLFFYSLLRAQSLQDRINVGLEMGISEQYAEALEHFAQIKRDFPDSPAGSFFSAAIFQSKMMDFETTHWKIQFYKEADLAIKLAENAIEKNPPNPNNYFFLGGAKAYKSFQMGREGKYLSAIKTAMSSMSNLNKAHEIDSTFCDSFLGIGSYQYWRSQVTKKLHWLPFFSDHRKEGIENIAKTIECSKYSKWAALSNLAWIYIEEKNFEKSIEYAFIGLDHFPNSRFFLWPLGDAQFQKGDYDLAIQSYGSILASVTKEDFNNHYNEIVLYYKLAQCHDKTNKLNKAFEFTQLAIKTKPDEEVKKRGKAIQSKALELQLSFMNRLEKNN
jgi:tetratricopeptide (TPR) repeat protein